MTPAPFFATDGTPASKLSFGTMQFGGKADKDEGWALYEASRVASINFFDTAYVYTKGLSEQYHREFAAAERDALVIASKCTSNSATIRAQLEESRSV